MEYSKSVLPSLQLSREWRAGDTVKLSLLSSVRLLGDSLNVYPEAPGTATMAELSVQSEERGGVSAVTTENESSVTSV